MRYVLLFLSYLILPSCSSSTANQETANNTQQNKTLTSSIKRSNTNSSLKNKLDEISSSIDLNCDSSSQCKIIGVGISPCGGFSKYLVYSEKNTDSKELKNSVEQFNQIMRIKNQKNNIVGICRHIEPPKTLCEVDQCSTLTNGTSI